LEIFVSFDSRISFDRFASALSPPSLTLQSVCTTLVIVSRPQTTTTQRDRTFPSALVYGTVKKDTQEKDLFSSNISRSASEQSLRPFHYACLCSRSFLGSSILAVFWEACGCHFAVDFDLSSRSLLFFSRESSFPLFPPFTFDSQDSHSLPTKHTYTHTPKDQKTSR